MPLLHDARRSDNSGATRDKHGLGIAVAKRLKLAKPSGENRRDAIKRELGVDAEQAFRFARGQMFRGMKTQTALEFGQRRGGQRKADGEGMASKAREEIGATFDGGEQGKSVDGAAGAVRYSVFNADDNGRLGGAFDHA